MLLQTLLNQCHKFSGFRYGKVSCDDQTKVVRVEILADKRTRPTCSKCHRPCSGYDQMKKRHFWFVPLWGYKVQLLYGPRRVQCPVDGVTIESMPWAAGKSPITKAFSHFLATWAKKLSWKEVAESFGVSWDLVYSAVQWVVDYGLKHRNLDGIKAIGIDEILFQRGYKFVTLVYEISEGTKRLLWVGRERKCKTLLGFFRMLGQARYACIEVVSCDMWQPFLKVIRKKIPSAIQILDRFHIMKKFNDAIEETRREEVKTLANQGKPDLLTNARWALLKKDENLTEKQSFKLKDLVAANLKSFKVRLLRDQFQKFWTYQKAGWAKPFLERWCFVAMRSQIEPVKKVAKMLRNHETEILNWFKVYPRVSNGVVEGFNNKIKLVMRKAYGYRTFHVFETALYHTMGNLPEPQMTHRFV